MVAFWWNIFFLLIYNHIRSEFVGKSHKMFQLSLSITNQSSESTISQYKLESKSCTRTKELLFAVYDAFITDLIYWPHFQFPLSKKNIMMYHLLMSWVTFEIKVYPCSAQVNCQFLILVPLLSLICTFLFVQTHLFLKKWAMKHLSLPWNHLQIFNFPVHYWYII